MMIMIYSNVDTVVN